MKETIEELWHGNIIPQEDSQTNSLEMKELLSYMAHSIAVLMYIKNLPYVVKFEKWACSTLEAGKNKPIYYIAKTRDFARFCEKTKENRRFG